MKKEWARLGSIAEMLRTDDQCAEKLAAKQFLPFYISLWLICLTGQHVLTAERRGGGEVRTDVLQRHNEWPQHISTGTITTISITIGLKWLVMFESSPPDVFKADSTRELLPGRAARRDKICWTTPARNEWEWSPFIPHIEASLEQPAFLYKLFHKKMHTISQMWL